MIQCTYNAFKSPRSVFDTLIADHLDYDHIKEHLNYFLSSLSTQKQLSLDKLDDILVKDLSTTSTDSLGIEALNTSKKNISVSIKSYKRKLVDIEVESEDEEDEDEDVIMSSGDDDDDYNPPSKSSKRAKRSSVISESSRSVITISAPKILDKKWIDKQVDKGANQLVTFLKKVQLALQKKSDSEFDKYIVSYIDGRSPLRETAPSRLIVNQEIGKLSKTFFATRKGLFSLLVFRGCTFGSALMNDSKYSNIKPKFILNNYNDFLSLKSKVEVDTDLYKKDAYGQYSHGRGPHNVSDYWENSFDWEDLMEVSPTFKEVYNYLLSTEKIDNSISKKFKEIGNLTAILICFDLVYGHVLPMPSIEELASCIIDLSKGGLHGLQRLKVLPNSFFIKNSLSKNDIVYEQTKDIIVSLYHKVTNLLGDQQEVLMPDVIHFEHLLCKISKAKKISQF